MLRFIVESLALMIIEKFSSLSVNFIYGYIACVSSDLRESAFRSFFRQTITSSVLTLSWSKSVLSVPIAVARE